MKRATKPKGAREPLSPRTARILKEGWNADDIEARLETARMLRRVKHQTPSWTGIGKRWSMLCAQKLAWMAIRDCKTLDAALAREGRPIGMLRSLILSSDEAMIAIRAFVIQEKLDLDAHKAQYPSKLQSRGSDTLARMAVDFVFELIESGWSANDAMTLRGETISSMASQGNAFFFEVLGRRLHYHRTKRVISRDAKAWILRLWLPLGLGDCEPSGKAAFERYRAAAALLSNEVPLTTLSQWKRSWNNVLYVYLKVKSEPAGAPG